MFLKVGALSLALLLASRILGLLRESVMAGAYGASGLADIVILMLTLPDWVSGVLASGALAYALLPAWAGQTAVEVAAIQRRVATSLLGLGIILALWLVVQRQALAGWLAPGVPPVLLPQAGVALVWSALAVPAALLAALWTTRLQHERDFAGMYGANLVVNGALIVIISFGAWMSVPDAVPFLGVGLAVAMIVRLAWLRWRIPGARPRLTPQETSHPVRTKSTSGNGLPAASVWLWAALSAGLPLALPFAARSIVSQSGEGALASFNYAWKLIELPLLLAIQLVATLALPAIARAAASADTSASRIAVRSAFALAWALACAATAALLLGADAIADLLFGWGRMDAAALRRIAQWGTVGAWSLLPQALVAVLLAVLAARQRMRVAVGAYAVALGLLLAVAATGLADGARLMAVLNFLQTGVAVSLLMAGGAQVRSWIPWRSMAVALACLVLVAGLSLQAPMGWSMLAGLSAGALAAVFVMGATWWGSTDLRAALAR